MKRIAAGVVLMPLVLAAAACSTAPKATLVTVTTSEYKFELPETFQGGLVQLTLDNTGGKEPHEGEIIRLDDGKTLADLEAAFEQDAPQPDWAHPAGGPGPVAPGDAAVYTSNLSEGTHVFVCHVPGPDGQAHLEKGMVAEVDVTAGDEGTVPAGDVTIETDEFAFAGQDGLDVGEQTVKVTNSGEQNHNVAMFALAPGKTVQDILGFFQGQGGGGPPPFTGIPGLMASMPPGFEGARTLDLVAGTYGLICFAPDTDGTPHFAKGMVAEVPVS